MAMQDQTDTDTDSVKIRRVGQLADSYRTHSSQVWQRRRQPSIDLSFAGQAGEQQPQVSSINRKDSRPENVFQQACTVIWHVIEKLVNGYGQDTDTEK